MANVLITGGAGFIGSHVAKQCLKLGHNVFILDDLSGGFIDHIPEGSHFIEGSITDKKLVEDLFIIHQFEYVYHLAAYAAEGLSHFIRKYNYETNLIGSINLINESVKRKVKCFVFTSSIAVYGAGQLPMREDMVPQPEDPYGISKYAIEMDLKCAHEMFGMNYIVFRPHNVYGTNQNIGDKYRNVIGIFINQMMQDKPLTVFGDGTQTRAFSYIDDVAIPIACSIHDKGMYNQVFNIGGDTPFKVLDLVNFIGELFNKKPDIKFLEARKEVLHAYADHLKIKQFFPQNSMTLYNGLGIMIEWAKKVGARKSKEFASIEIRENLPEGW
jgi:UDP-glucose 4-epimerase